MQLVDDQPFRLLIHDRDKKFSGAFGEVFRSEGIRVIRTPVQAPNANSPSLSSEPAHFGLRFEGLVFSNQLTEVRLLAPATSL
jgi:hypothetical protein